MIQNSVLHLELKDDRANDIQIEVSGGSGFESSGGVKWLVLEALVASVLGEA